MSESPKGVGLCLQHNDHCVKQINRLGDFLPDNTVLTFPLGEGEIQKIKVMNWGDVRDGQNWGAFTIKCWPCYTSLEVHLKDLYCHLPLVNDYGIPKRDIQRFYLSGPTKAVKPTKSRLLDKQTELTVFIAYNAEKTSTPVDSFNCTTVFDKD